MRELTMQEMEQVSGGFLLQAAGACAAGAVTQNNGALGGIMGCAGGTASGLAFTLAVMSGPVGAVALIGVGVGIAYATYQAQEHIEELKKNQAPGGS